MIESVLVLSPLILLSSGALLSLAIANRARRAANAILLLTSLASFAPLVYSLISGMSGGETFEAFGYLLNPATSLFAMLILALGLAATVYSTGYMEHEPAYNLYMSALQVFILSMIYIALAMDMLLVYLTFELSTAAGGILITFSRRRSSLYAALRFFVLNVPAALLVLAGLVLQYYYVQDFSIAAIAELPASAKNLVLLLYTLGFAVKAGIVPFGLVWLPPAHSEAPIPIHTLLSAALVQSAAFVLLKAYGFSGSVNRWLVDGMLVLGIASMLAGALEAFIEAIVGSRYSRFHVGSIHICGIKRVWAFSTISEMGYVLTFLALYLYDPRPEFAAMYLGGALLHMVNHGFAKAQLLFDTGVAIKVCHAEDLNYMGGAMRIYPVGVLTFCISAVSLGLLPGFAGYGTLRELFLNPYSPASVKFAVIPTALLTVLAILISLYRAFISKPKARLTELSEIPVSMRIPGPFLALCLIAVGVAYTATLWTTPEVVEEFMHLMAEGIALGG